MSIPTFASQVEAWSSPPIDDVGYIPSSVLLEMPDDELRAVISQMEVTRYQGYRNDGNRWREVLGLDSTTGKDVLDYGCGTGIEALQYAKAGNQVSLADIAPGNLALASRVLSLYGYHADEVYEIAEVSPLTLHGASDVDVIHCAGVLHHVPYPHSVVEEMATWLRPGGELRLLLYSDVAWERATGAPASGRPEFSEHFDTYVKAMDGVGGYADWYDCVKLRDRFCEWFDVERCEYVGNEHFIGAVMVKR